MASRAKHLGNITVPFNENMDPESLLDLDAIRMTVANGMGVLLPGDITVELYETHFFTLAIYETPDLEGGVNGKADED